MTNKAIFIFATAIAFGLFIPVGLAQRGPDYTIQIDKNGTAATLKVNTNGKSKFVVENKTGKEVELQLENDEILKIPPAGINAPYESDGGEIQLTVEGTEKIFDPTKIKIGGKALAAPSGSEPEKNSDTDIFIPSLKQEAVFREAASADVAHSDCCPGSQELIYDYAARCFIPTCEGEACFCRQFDKLTKRLRKDSIATEKDFEKKWKALLKLPDSLAGQRESRKSTLLEERKIALDSFQKKYKADLALWLKKQHDPTDPFATCYRCTSYQTLFHKFHPRVDGILHIRVTGQHPYRDNVELGVGFEDRNKEDRTKFVAMLDKAGKPWETTKASGAAPSSDTSSNEGAAQNAEDKTKVIEKFADEMAKFYTGKLAASPLSASFLGLCVLHIQERIRTVFEISAASADLMDEKVDKWLDEASIDPKEKQRLRAKFKEGLANYQRILAYRPSSAWLFQIKNSDVTKLEFKWSHDGRPVSEEPQTFRFFNKGGFTIDYSTGIVINGLVNHSFTTRAEEVSDTISTNPVTIDTVVKYRILRKKDSDINLGAAVFAHAYYRYPGWSRFKVAATTGFMANARDNEFNLNYLFGGSLLFGSEQRFVLTAGCVIGKVARLAEGLEAGLKDGTLLDPPTTAGETTEVTVRDVYRRKWFIGITYNLGN